MLMAFVCLPLQQSISELLLRIQADFVIDFSTLLICCSFATLEETSDFDLLTFLEHWMVILNTTCPLLGSCQTWGSEVKHPREWACASAAIWMCCTDMHSDVTCSHLVYPGDGGIGSFDWWRNKVFYFHGHSPIPHFILMIPHLFNRLPLCCDD